MLKAAAIRFFSDHIGCEFDIVQAHTNGTSWRLAPRILHREGAQMFRLGGSTVEFTPAHRVIEVTDGSVTVELRTDDSDGDGEGGGRRVVHTTTYSVVPF